MDNNNRNLPTQGVLAVRILIGGYLLYLSQSLVKDRATSSMKPVVMWAFVVIFTVIGIALVAMAIKNYYKGEYIGGKADVSANEEDTEDAAEAEAIEAEVVENADVIEGSKVTESSGESTEE